MDSYLENAMDYVQEAFESANQWMKENDPLRFPVVKASVWDALDNDREVGRDRNEGRDYVRISIAGTMDSDYKKGAYSRDPGEDRNARSDYSSSSSNGRDVIVIDNSDVDSVKKTFGPKTSEFLGEWLTEHLGYTTEQEAKVEKEAKLKKADDELKELKEKHQKILEDTSKSSDANAEAMGKNLQGVIDKTSVAAAEGLGAATGGYVGGILGGVVAGPAGVVPGQVVGIAVGKGVGGQLGEYSVEKAKEIVNEGEKDKDEL